MEEAHGVKSQAPTLEARAGATHNLMGCDGSGPKGEFLLGEEKGRGSPGHARMPAHVLIHVLRAHKHKKERTGNNVFVD